jgi:ABC-type glycerol-3-phosphate transport system substrate-binding protein
MATASLSRRRFLKRTALAIPFAAAAPYMRTSYSAGRLTLGCWDHWVPGANDVLAAICNEWGAANHVDVQIDFVTSIGQKNLLTASAEAQARAGHDIFAHPSWQVQVHRAALEPVDDVVDRLVKEHGPVVELARYLALDQGTWKAVPAIAVRQVKPCCSRIDLYKQYCDVDIVKMFPADERKRDKALVDSWTWDLYLSTAQKLFKAGYPIGLPMGQTSDSIDWVGALFRSYGSVFVDEKDNIKIDSPETRAALDYAVRLMAFNPPDVYAWDDSGNNKWLISGRGSSVMNPPSAWAVAKRDNPKVAEQCWTHDLPRGPKGRFAPYLPYYYGIWSFGQNKTAAKELVHHMVDKPQAKRQVAASSGYDLPSFKTYYDFDTWQTVEPPLGTVYNYPPRGDEELSMAGQPARPDIAAQIWNQALEPVMIAKLAQGGETIDGVVKWAQRECEGYLRG